MRALPFGWAPIVVLSFVLGSCASELECGEQNLPGTEACPCLPGGVCATDLVCEADICYPRSVDDPEDDGDDDDSPGGTEDGPTGTGTGSTDDDTGGSTGDAGTSTDTGETTDSTGTVDTETPSVDGDIH